MRRITILFSSIAAAIALVAYAQAQHVSSSRSDVADLAMVIFEGGGSLVTESRNLKLPKGQVELVINDVPPGIVPDSIILRTDAPGKNFSVLEQRYEHDRLGPAWLAEKFIGKEVFYQKTNELMGEKKLVPATLLGVSQGLVIKVEGRIMMNVEPEDVVFPKMPDSVSIEPVIKATILNDTSKGQVLQISYIVEGVTWEPSYAITLKKNGNSDVSASAVISNHGLFIYKDAKVRLASGRALSATAPREKPMGVAYLEEQTRRPAALPESYSAKLSRRVSLKEKDVLQVNLFNAQSLAASLKFAFPPDMDSGRADESVEIELAASVEAGRHLPAGPVRVYKWDDDGGVQFVSGEFGGVSREMALKVNTGPSSTVSGERTYADTQKLNQPGASERTVTVRLTNTGTAEARVDSIERVPPGAEIRGAEFRRLETGLVAFTAVVPAGKKETISYSFDVKTPKEQ
jgi:hypothetical protein